MIIGVWRTGKWNGAMVRRRRRRRVATIHWRIPPRRWWHSASWWWCSRNHPVWGWASEEVMYIHTVHKYVNREELNTK